MRKEAPFKVISVHLSAVGAQRQPSVILLSLKHVTNFESLRGSSQTNHPCLITVHTQR